MGQTPLVFSVISEVELPYKVFQDGDVLTAQDVNDYIMEQQVTVFDNEAARSSAIATPLHGMISYRKDNGRFYYYTGSNWRGL